MVLTPSRMLALGTPLPHFALPNPASGQQMTTAQYRGKPLLVAFICNHCPYVVHIQPVFARLCNDLVEQGMGVVAISANDSDNYPEDGPEKMVAITQQYGYRFPYLYDESQGVATAFQAACTPDFYLFDASHALVYRGQFDAARPGNAVPVSGADLRAAAEAVLNQATVPGEQHPSMGCNIKWKTGRAPA